MSIEPSPGSAGLPVVNQALEPAWVRHGSPSTQKAYETALSFERTLVEQLSKSLAAAGGLGSESSQEGESGLGEGGSPGAGAQSGELSSMLPQALSAGVMNAGGLGLAAQLTRELQGVHGAAQAGATGGTGVQGVHGGEQAATTGGTDGGGGS
ncbi:MAG TPA: hypothetical protein VES97_11890 [Solirubrobacteraceae bacterium]|nr:hypothetical protein [Solirubrobacteraceae bacterium]HYM67113.1 hypothetical protein [Patescibacteria group bacterium]